MRLDSDPPLHDDELVALARALARAGLPLDGAPAAYRSRWKRTAGEEAVDDAPPDLEDRYAPSPRSTRGATRA
jgi:hypothetical protein